MFWARGTDSVLLLLMATRSSLPHWLQSPFWLREASLALRSFLNHNQAAGLFGVIFAEELGIPLPVPGDVAISLAGFLTTQGHLDYFMAYACVVGGAVLGSACLLAITRRFGRGFLLRFGRYAGVDELKLTRAEQAFTRWGHWAIIVGRLIPGMRIVLTAIAGVLNVPYRVFVPSVLVSSVIWAAIFIELGRHLGRRTLALFRLFPTHLLPWLLLALAIGLLVYYTWERRRAAQAATAAQDSATHARA